MLTFFSEIILNLVLGRIRIWSRTRIRIPNRITDPDLGGQLIMYPPDPDPQNCC
jgi:hypothetical protein